MRAQSGVVVLGALACGLSWTLACTMEDVVAVDVAAVAVVPSSANAMEGERVRLQATVRDEYGDLLDGAAVTWSSSDPSVAMVGQDGWVDARSPGTVEVTASYQDAVGSASVRVLPGPSIAVSHASVAMAEIVGGSAPDTVEVFVTNGGGGTLEGLQTSVAYPAGGPVGWLAHDLAATRAPTSITLTASIGSLAVGAYAATLSVSASDVDGGPLDIPVTLTVVPQPPPPPPTAPGLVIVESGGGTYVTEGGGYDTVTVALTVRPTSNVVIQIRSANTAEVTVAPASVTFTPANWNVPRAVILTGVDEVLLPDPDGDQVVDVTISVTDAQSDAAYRGLSETVRATNVDNDTLLPGD